MNIQFNKFILFFAVLLFIGHTSFGQTSKDSSDVIKSVNGVSKYFFEQKMDLFADLWDKDATFVTVTGLMAKGKDAIVDLHSFGKYLIDSSSAPILPKPMITFHGKDLAIAYCIWGGLVMKGKDGKKEPVESGYLTIVLQRQKSGWKIISATNAENFLHFKNYKFVPYSHEKALKMFGVEEKK